MHRSDMTDVTDWTPPEEKVVSAHDVPPQPLVQPARLTASTGSSCSHSWPASACRRPIHEPQSNLAGYARRLAILVAVGTLLALAPRTAGGTPDLPLATRRRRHPGPPVLLGSVSRKFPTGNSGPSRGRSRMCLMQSRLKESFLRGLPPGGKGTPRKRREFRLVSRGNRFPPLPAHHPNPRIPL
jgi:hypothetical protein